jgi:hypothetical protein
MQCAGVLNRQTEEKGEQKSAYSRFFFFLAFEGKNFVCLCGEMSVALLKILLNSSVY